MQTTRAGDVLFTFDGEVLELFGWLRRNIGIDNAANIRFHVSLLDISVEEPDRKGKRRVTFRIPGGELSCDLFVEEPDWAAFGPFLDTVRAAIVA